MCSGASPGGVLLIRICMVSKQPNAERRHSLRGQRHDKAEERRISECRRKRKGQRLLPQVMLLSAGSLGWEFCVIKTGVHPRLNVQIIEEENGMGAIDLFQPDNRSIYSSLHCFACEKLLLCVRRLLPMKERPDAQPIKHERYDGEH